MIEHVFAGIGALAVFAALVIGFIIIATAVHDRVDRGIERERRREWRDCHRLGREAAKLSRNMQ